MSTGSLHTLHEANDELKHRDDRAGTGEDGGVCRACMWIAGAVLRAPAGCRVCSQNLYFDWVLVCALVGADAPMDMSFLSADLDEAGATAAAIEAHMTSAIEADNAAGGVTVGVEGAGSGVVVSHSATLSVIPEALPMTESKISKKKKHTKVPDASVVF